MESNLTVTANFATNQFIGMAGRYDGIFYPSEPPPATVTNSGLVENLHSRPTVFTAASCIWPEAVTRWPGASTGQGTRRTRSAEARLPAVTRPLG